jgi:hypothetical protein
VVNWGVSNILREVKKMENSTIEKFEDIIIRAAESTKNFRVRIEYEQRDAKNYNHLGTLDVNCKVLRSQLDRLIELLGY